MRELILRMSISLDGFVAGPDGEIDWIFRHRGADSTAWIVDTLRQAGVHAMGSRTYRDMAAFWPTSDTPFTPAMNDISKIVFSRSGLPDRRAVETTAPPGATPTAAVLRSWAEPAVASGDLLEEVARLKAQPGGFVVAHGGARFAQSLAAAGLVDEYRLTVIPVALGRGLPLFSGLSHPVDLRLVAAVPFAAGTLGIVYRPA